MNLKFLIPLSLSWLLLLGCSPQSAQAEKVWSPTEPAINATHIFLGEINRSGKPTGYHARPGGKDPKSARVARIKQSPNRAGVYTASVEIRDPASGRWKEKFSSMFPDQLSHGEVVQAILHAYEHREKGKDQPWRGPSGLGFPIQGYTLRDGRINTAFPVYIRDRR